MKRLACLIALVCTSLHQSAVASFVVEDVRVEGLQRISAGTVFNYLPIQVGDTLQDDQYSEVLKSLFKTGFFVDVRIEREGNVLILKVVERPSIAEIKFDGNKDLSDDALSEALKQVGLAEGQVFDRSLLDRTEQELRRQYLARGKYSARIKSQVTDLERNRVAITIDISEGAVARIKQINIIGNHAFDDEELLDQFELSAPDWLTWLSKRDRYSKPKLTADLETLRSFYLDRGYVQFSVDSTQVSITPDRSDIYITINVTEGDQFTISDVRLAGDLKIPEADLSNLVTVAPGEVFSRAKATESARAISDRFGDDGYAFTNVNTIPEVDEENKQVSITLFVDPGKRVYVRRINMSGNTRTHDVVMRRELRQMEGAWFSTTKVDRSRTRLERLGYFDEVNVETPAVPDAPDQVDVNYSVTERSSGTLAMGVGFSQTSGLLFNANIDQNNFMGTGRSVRLGFNTSKVNTVYSIGYTNPYYTVDGVSRGFNLFFRETDASEANLSDYTLDRLGGDVNYGIPLTEFDYLRFAFGYERTEVNVTESTPEEILAELEEKGTNVFRGGVLDASWSRDTRNRAIFADRGMLNRVNLEMTLPSADWEFYKIGYRNQTYFPFTKDLTFGLHADLGYGDGYGDDSDIPFYENYYAGGVRSVRGYKANTLGPRFPDTGDPSGGSLKVTGGAEIIFPPPLLGQELQGLRLTAFVDVGNVFAEPGDFEFQELRASAGLGALWLSPFGPLNFNLALPLNDKPGDETESFQFTIGAPF